MPHVDTVAGHERLLWKAVAQVPRIHASEKAMFNRNKITWKIVKHGVSNTVTLVCKVKGGDLDYEAAQRLVSSKESLFLPFRYEESKKKNDITFYYDVTGCTPVPTMTKARLLLPQYRNLVTNVADVTDLCTRSGISDSYIQWDSQRVWWSSEHNSLRFVVTPVRMEHKAPPLTPFDFLTFLSNPDAVAFVSERDVAALDKVNDYVRRTAVFSSMGLRSFVDKNFGHFTPTTSSSTSSHVPVVSPSNQVQTVGTLNPVMLMKDGEKEPPLTPPSHSVSTPTPSPDLGQISATPMDSEQQIPTNQSRVSLHAQANGFPPEAQKTNIITPATPHTHSLASDQSLAHRFSITRMRDGKRVEWEKAVVTVGRSSAADICMEGNLDISRIHLQIRPDGLESFEIVDLGSTNGTCVGGTVLHREQSAYMKSGETFEMGGEQFLLENIS